MTRRLNKKGRPRRWPWVVGGLALLGLVLVVDLAWAGTRAVGGFRQARDGLRDGGDQLLSGDLQAASSSFEAADAASARASAALGHPAVTVASWVPWLGNNVDAARHAANASELAARGGAAYVNAADVAGWDGTTIPGFGEGGQIDSSVIQRAAPGIEQAAELLDQAEGELDAVDANALVPPLDSLVADAQNEIRTRASQASAAAAVARLLPPMLGLGGARDYLLVTQTQSDPRAAGGYPGVYGLLHVDGKQLSLSRLSTTGSVPGAKPPVDGPADAKRVWHWAGIDQYLWDTTYTPDFPTAAGFMKGIWEASGGTPVDGVIAGDTALMASLVGVVGPVDTPAWPQQLTADNVGRTVGADVYKTTDGAESDAWQLAIGEALWGAILTRPWPLEPMGAAIASARDGGHLRVWSTHQDEQAELTDLGVSGAFVLPADGGPVVTYNGFTPNRVGFFATKELQVVQGEDEQGQPTITATVTVHNGAPEGPPSVMLGVVPGDTGGKPRGTFGTDINVYVPGSAHVVSVKLNGKRTVPFEWHELGAHAVSVSPLIPPGKTATMEVTYRLAA